MTEPHHEPSYYEIALTNRQVVVAFVILLVCLLAAFFSGVWIGRGGIDSRKDQIVRATPPAPAVPTEGRTLEELKFFADRQAKKGGKSEKAEKAEEKPVEVAQAQAPAPEEKPSPSPPAAAPPAPEPAPAQTTLQQDIGQPRQNPAARSRSVVRATPPAPAPVAPAAEEPAPRPAASERGDRAARTADTAASGSSAAGTGGAGAGSIVIQVFASADQAEANRVRDRLTKGGQAAFLSPLTVDGRTMYRVRIGPFASRPKAQQVAEKVRKTYKLDTWLTQ